MTAREADEELEALHVAAREGDLSMVRELLARGFDVDAFDDDLRLTPLHYAAMAGHVEIIRVLLEAGANVDAHDAPSIGNTPLREVVGNCTHEVAEILIRAGADPRIPGWMQLTALQVAAKRERPEGVRVHELLRMAAARLDG